MRSRAPRRKPVPPSTGPPSSRRRSRWRSVAASSTIFPARASRSRGLGTHHDPDWWIRRKIETENLTGLGPPAILLRTEDRELNDQLDLLGRESDVRDVLEDFNKRVREARRQLQGGPPVVTEPRDVDAEVVGLGGASGVAAGGLRRCRADLLAVVGSGRAETGPESEGGHRLVRMTDVLPVGLALDEFSSDIRPQDDLYRHVNGAWLSRTEIPGDKARWGSFHLLAPSRPRKTCGRSSRSRRDAEEGTLARKIGDLFASFMDTERIDAAGLSPLVETLAEVDAIDGIPAFLRTVGAYDRDGRARP